MTLPRTPSQTVGPFLSLVMDWPDGPFVVPQGTPGAIWIRGLVLDGAGAPIEDAVVETWQPNAEGQFSTRPDQVSFRGFGRATTVGSGRWAILTVKPGSLEGSDGRRQAPYVAAVIFARGLLKPVWTRIYFADETDANDADALLAMLDPERARTLLATPEPDGYRFDIHLQGSAETVFFDV